MKHRIIEGSIYHKRTSPKSNSFTYPFFMMDIDTDSLEELKNKFFSLNKYNLFSFHSKDHFGKEEEFKSNIHELLNTFHVEGNYTIRFITLPRILGFVFNPISMLILFEDKTPKLLFAEVHNYNGGRMVYHVTLEKKHNMYWGKSSKDMYVSPFLSKEGDYEFSLKTDEHNFLININLIQKKHKILRSTFRGKFTPYNDKRLLSLFFKYGFLTLKVVTRTLWQTLRLKLKGLRWFSPELIDQKRRF